VPIKAGEEVRLNDLSVESLSPARVTGRVLDSVGRPLRGSVILSTSQRSRMPLIQPQMESLAPDGSFEFDAVAPGEYVLQATGPGQPAGREFGVEFVTVAATDPAPVTVIAAVGPPVSGRIVLEGDMTGLRPDDFSVALVAADVDRSPLLDWVVPRPTVAPDWTFSVAGVTGVYRVVANKTPDGWWLKSVSIDGVNAADDGVSFDARAGTRSDVQIVFAQSAASIKGRAADSMRPGKVEYTAVVYPVDRLHWYARSRYMAFKRSDKDGLFDIGGLPPGDYWVAAVDAIDISRGCGDWQQADVLNTLMSSARRLRLGPGQRTTIDLELMRLSGLR